MQRSGEIASQHHLARVYLRTLQPESSCLNVTSQCTACLAGHDSRKTPRKRPRGLIWTSVNSKVWRPENWRSCKIWRPQEERAPLLLICGNWNFNSSAPRIRHQVIMNKIGQRRCEEGPALKKVSPQASAVSSTVRQDRRSMASLTSAHLYGGGCANRKLNTGKQSSTSRIPAYL